MRRAFEQAGIRLDAQFPTVQRFPGMVVGVWLMPDNMNKGQLEDFLESLIPMDDELLVRAREYVASIPAPRLFEDRHEVKARVRSWLAVQKEPGFPYGRAVGANYFGNIAAAQPFVDWLRQTLFDEPNA